MSHHNHLKIAVKLFITQVQPLCGPIEESEEQLFGYQVMVDRG